MQCETAQLDTLRGLARYRAMDFLPHIIMAVITQAAVGLLTRNWWAGAAVASAYFIGREVAQAEYRWIEHFGEGLRANMPWWAPLDLRVWAKLDPWLDWIGPVVATCSVAVVIARRRARAERPGAG